MRTNLFQKNLNNISFSANKQLALKQFTQTSQLNMQLKAY